MRSIEELEATIAERDATIAGLRSILSRRLEGLTIEQWRDEYFRRHKDAAENSMRMLTAESQLAERDREIAELREDAERYRWLRDHSGSGADFCMEAFDIVRTDGTQWDTAIDAARSAKP